MKPTTALATAVAGVVLLAAIAARVAADEAPSNPQDEVETISTRIATPPGPADPDWDLVWNEEPGVMSERRGDARQVIDRFSRTKDSFSQERGEALYRTSCQGCHMADGEGAEGAGTYPPLAGNPKLVSRHYMIGVLTTGLHGMPAFGDQMDDEQIASVVNFVRSSFGNAFPDEATPKDVRALRGR